MKPTAVSIGFAAGLLILTAPASFSQRQPAASTALYRHHFAGATQITRATNSPRFNKIWARPESQQLRDHVLQKFAQVPYRVWRGELPAGAADQSALFRPLLEDWVNVESYLEIRGPTNRTESALAVQLGDDRAQLWSTNLWQAAAVWRLGVPAQIKVEGFSGWELKKKGTPNLFQMVRVGQWLVVGLGQDRLTVLPAWVQQAAKSGRPGPALNQNWFECDLDCPGLSGWFPILRTCQVPPARLAVDEKGELLRTTMQLRSPQKISWTFEPWKIPTNYISEPLISFTVAQGIAPLLARLKGVPELGLKPPPNQVCLWGQMSEHVQTCFTVPIAAATNTMKQLEPKLHPFVLTYLPDALGEFKWITNRFEMFWRGVPFVLPTLRPIQDSGVDYLLGSLYPIRPTGKPVPPELFAQLAGQPSMLYYDWEMTSERLPQENRLLQIMSIVCERRLPPTNSPTLKWLTAVAPLLGETRTKIARTGDNELTLVRNSQIGLTGFEIALLTRWIESPGFPLSFERPPAATERLRKTTEKAPAKPARR